VDPRLRQRRRAVFVRATDFDVARTRTIGAGASHDGHRRIEDDTPQPARGIRRARRSRRAVHLRDRGSDDGDDDGDEG